jgi:hypothetical protein
VYANPSKSLLGARSTPQAHLAPEKWTILRPNGKLFSILGVQRFLSDRRTHPLRRRQIRQGHTNECAGACGPTPRRVPVGTDLVRDRLDVDAGGGVVGLPAHRLGEIFGRIAVQIGSVFLRGSLRIGEPQHGVTLGLLAWQSSARLGRDPSASRRIPGENLTTPIFRS